MRRTDTPNRYGRRTPTSEDRNLALPAVPAASTKGSTGRQHVAAARTLPTADSAAANPPFEEALPVTLLVSLLISNEDEWPNQNGIDVKDVYLGQQEHNGGDQEWWRSERTVKGAISDPVRNAADAHGKKDGGGGRPMQRTPIDSYEAECSPRNQTHSEPIAHRRRWAAASFLFLCHNLDPPFTELRICPEEGRNAPAPLHVLAPCRAFSTAR